MKKPVTIIVSLLVFISFFAVAYTALCQEVRQETAPSIYAEGCAHFRDSKYSLARESFLKLILLYPDSDFAPSSIFKIGESFYRQSAYEKAGSYFRLYLERFTLGKNAADARYRLLACEKKVGRKIGVAHPKMDRVFTPMKALRVRWFFQSSIPQLEKNIAGLKAKGINTLILPSFFLAGEKPHRLLKPKAKAGALFHTTHTPVCQDILPQIAAIAHKYGIRLIVEFPVSSLPTGPRDAIWNPVDKVLKPSAKLDIFAPESLQVAAAIIKDLAKNSIDGVLITKTEMTPIDGFSPHAHHVYMKSGKPLMQDFKEGLFTVAIERVPGIYKYEVTPEYSAISSIKCEHVSSFARKLVRAGREINPNLDFWVEIAPLSAQDPAQGMIRLSQDGENLGNPPFSGIYLEVDLRKLSRTESLTEGSLSDSIGRLLKGALAFTDPDHLVLGIKIEDSIAEKTAPDWQIETVFGKGRKVGINSFSVGPWSLRYDYSKIYHKLGNIPGFKIKENRGE